MTREAIKKVKLSRKSCQHLNEFIANNSSMRCIHEEAGMDLEFQLSLRSSDVRFGVLLRARDSERAQTRGGDYEKQIRVLRFVSLTSELQRY